MDNNKEWLEYIREEYKEEVLECNSYEEAKAVIRKLNDDLHYFEGEQLQKLIELLNKKAIYSRDNELVSFHVSIRGFYDLSYIKRPVSNGFSYLSNTEESSIRSCFCKLKSGERCSLEDIYSDYYPDYANKLKEEDLLNAIETMVADRRKNSRLYTLDNLK